jgi:hypothetical protein
MDEVKRLTCYAINLVDSIECGDSESSINIREEPSLLVYGLFRRAWFISPCM